MTDYCWKKLPYNSGTAVILVWCSKQLKSDFAIFKKLSFLIGRQFFLIYCNTGFSFFSGGCVHEVVDIRVNCQDTNDVHILQSYILGIVKEHYV